MERAWDCIFGKLFGLGLDRPLTLLECGLLSESENPGWICLPWKDGHQRKLERESVNTSPTGTPGTAPSWGSLGSNIP